MTDESKQSAAAGEPKAVESPVAETAGGEKKVQAAKPAPLPEAPAKAGSPPKKEKPEKCEHCGKQLKRIKWYYRNNGYYCTKRCWREFARKQAEERQKEEPEAAATAG